MRARRPSWAAPVFLLFSVLLAASCARAPVAWDKPGATRDDWTRDQWDCRAKARREIDKDMRQRGPSLSSSGFGDNSTLSRDMARFDAEREERRMFEQCLKLRGYAKKKTGGER